MDRKHIQFQPLQPADIVKISEVEVVHQELYTNHDDGRRTTARDGPLDARMVRKKTDDCLTIGTERKERDVRDMW